MKNQDLISELECNKKIFRDLLSGIKQEVYEWRLQPDKWNLLEIVCHLYDEEKEDFRARLRHVLESPGKTMPSIDPQGWVKSRKYQQENYDQKLKEFLEERENSVQWLSQLQEPRWENVYLHPTLGSMSADMFIHSWVAHDYLHFRQITRLKYQFLKSKTAVSLDYAGEW